MQGEQVREQALLSQVLAGFGLLLLLPLLVAAVFITASFGWSWELLAAVAGLLAVVVLGLRPPAAAPPPGRWRWLERLRGVGKKALVVALTGWLALIAWSRLGCGGPMPGAKAAPDRIRVLTWNILRGQEHGPPWEQNNWPRRKRALAGVLHNTQPDLLLVQEARAGQLAFLDETLPAHRRIGMDRDGNGAGEHCAIYFRPDRFEYLDDGTFWLEEPTDQPPGPGSGVKRICTWVRLRDGASGRTLRVYNTHQYLTARAQQSAAVTILDHIQAGDPSDAVLLGGDFNATPAAASRRLFDRAGLRETAVLARQDTQGTYQLCGLRLRCLDGILAGPGWCVHHHAVVNVKPGGVFPSDHFGVLADLTPER